MKPRVGLIGARRRRQGLGPFVARDLVSAGAVVPCFLSSSTETIAAGRAALLEHAGTEAHGYTELHEMVEKERLDAVAILSPSDTHDSYLGAAAKAGLHVLCEKPLLWGEADLLARARARVDSFRSRRLLLAENCQWPYTLDAFRELHPDLRDGPPRSFQMRLSPTSTGLELVGDCLPHPLSLLQRLAPGEEAAVRAVRYSAHAPDLSHLRVEFEFESNGARIEVELDLQPSGFPRVASLVVDGRRAERRIRLLDYRMSYADGDRSVPLPDPLPRLVHKFVSDLRGVLDGGTPPDTDPILRRMAMLETLECAYRGQEPDLVR